MPNVFMPLGTGADFDQARAVINANFAQLDNEAVTKVFKRASGNAFVQGKLPGDTGYGFLMYDTNGLVAIACYVDSSGQPILKVAKEGYDALTATNDQLVFNSAQNVFKIVLTGTGVLDANGATAGVPITNVIPHNLGYTPIPQVFMDNGGALSPLPFATGNGLSGGSVTFNTWVYATVSSTDLHISLVPGSTASYGLFNYRYYLLQETAN